MSDNFRSKFRTALTEMLPRLRQALPLPVAPEDLYRSAFPEKRLADWCMAPIETDFRNMALPYRNLTKCVHRTALVHFCLNTEEELDAMTDDSVRELMWVAFPRHVAAPLDIGALIVGEPLRNDPRMLDWYNAATALDESINEMTTLVYQIVMHLSNASEVALAWPEVVTAVPSIVPPSAKLRVAARSPRIPKLRREIQRAFPPDKMEKLSNMLATAIMLPQSYTLRAWVGIKDPFSEELTP